MRRDRDHECTCNQEKTQDRQQRQQESSKQKKSSPLSRYTSPVSVALMCDRQQPLCQVGWHSFTLIGLYHLLNGGSVLQGCSVVPALGALVPPAILLRMLQASPTVQYLGKCLVVSALALPWPLSFWSVISSFSSLLLSLFSPLPLPNIDRSMNTATPATSASFAASASRLHGTSVVVPGARQHHSSHTGVLFHPDRSRCCFTFTFKWSVPPPMPQPRTGLHGQTSSRTVL